MTTTTDWRVWFRRFAPPRREGPRLVCFPHAGGAAGAFFPLGRAFEYDVEVLGVQYPGRQDRRSEPCVTDTVELAERALPAVAALAADRPLVLLGHSLGATVAFEVARRLDAAGTPPALLVASARCAPSRHRSSGMHGRDDDALVAEMVRLGGSDPEVLRDAEMLALVLPVLRGDYEASDLYDYRPGPPLRCPVVGMAGDADPRIRPVDVAGWADHTSARFELVVLPGGHFYLHDDPGRFAAAVRRVLAAAVPA